tara:strand:+ start:139 stop:2457 length:2319 start_codon:yes stop_codon:yes gene_type:complete
MMQFKGFKPKAMQSIAGKLGYRGNMSGFNDYLAQNPDKKTTMDMYQNKAVQMMNGGMAKRNYAVGGVAEYDRDAISKIARPIDGKLSPDVDQGFYNSQEYRDFQNNPGNRVGTTAMYDSPFFGSMGSSSVGKAQDRAYEAYLATKNTAIDPRVQLGTVPRTYNYTYEQAVGRQSQKDVKSPEEAAAIAAAISRGPDTDSSVGGVPQTTASIADISAQRVQDPRLPTGTQVNPVGTVVQQDQLIDPASGQLKGDIVSPTALADTAQATAPTATEASTIDPRTVSADVNAVADATTAAQGTVDPNAIITGAQQTTTAVSDLTAAQGTTTLMSNPVQRKIEAGELITGVADAAVASAYTEQIQAATATPTDKATVKGQLDGLMKDFDDGATPSWAAGAMRAANTAMIARGLGSSSMAGQAIIQATMESALPIAQADAKIVAGFEVQNLSNRQQRAMLAAEQRAKFMGQEFDQAFQARVSNSAKVSDIANMNFTADQQVALENSRIANTMNLANLSNRQALVMGEAAALSQLDVSNLNNRQQAAVTNAQNLMQMDLTNLSNEQAVEIFTAQQRIQSLFTDQAQENAAKQFNATSENQTEQFFANLASTTAQFNTSQSNAQSQFNAGATNAQNNFTSEMMNQRDQFNAQNKLVIEQSNATWRRQIATADTIAVNRANELNAASMLDISNTAYTNMWQYYADTMEYAYTAANSERDRMTELAIAKLTVDSKFDIAKWNADSTSTAAMGNAIVKIATSSMGGDGGSIVGDAWNMFKGQF